MAVLITKSILFVIVIWFVVGCGIQSAEQLPTLAALPTIPPTPEPVRTLEFWQIADGTLASPDEIGRWQFPAVAGDPIRLGVLGTVSLSLLAPDGTALGSGETIELTLPVDGLYTVEVRLTQGESSAYRLSLGYTDRPNPADFTATPPPVTVGIPTPTPVFADLGLFIADLENGATMAETFLRGPVLPHVYTFTGKAGEYVTVRMSRISGTVDPALRLYDPNGAALAVDHNSGGNRAALLRNIILRADGQYSIQADGGGGPGDYEITLTSGPQPVPVTPTIIAPPTITPFRVPLGITPAMAVQDGLLEPYVPVISSLMRPGDVNRHTITGSEGDFVSINVRKLQAESRLRPVIEVYSPVGDRIGMANARTSNAGGEALIQLLPIPESGTYSIFVSAEGGDSGDYLISYGMGALTEGVARGPATADTPYENQIMRRGQRDSWDVLLNAGDVITIAAGPLNNSLDPVIELVAPDGTLVASDDNSGGYPNALINQVQAPVGGLYQLYVSASGGNTVGPYRLVWRYHTIAPTPTYDPPRILLFTVEDDVPQGEYAFYPFQGTAGQQVRISVNAQAAGGFDPVAALIGPDGRELAMGDDGPDSLNPQFSAALPVDGTYQVRVNGYLSGGPFELVVERIF